MDACCEAMQQEVKPTDLVILGKDSGAGMSVRYQLPRMWARPRGLAYPNVVKPQIGSQGKIDRPAFNAVSE